ncbi:MAG: hypothetical protein HRF50_14070 [Phycisphaerae bacterium]
MGDGWMERENACPDPRCCAPLPLGARFCPRCGRAVEGIPAELPRRQRRNWTWFFVVLWIVLWPAMASRLGQRGALLWFMGGGALLCFTYACHDRDEPPRRRA